MINTLLNRYNKFINLIITIKPSLIIIQDAGPAYILIIYMFLPVRQQPI